MLVGSSRNAASGIIGKTLLQDRNSREYQAFAAYCQELGIAQHNNGADIHQLARTMMQQFRDAGINV